MPFQTLARSRQCTYDSTYHHVKVLEDRKLIAFRIATWTDFLERRRERKRQSRFHSANFVMANAAIDSQEPTKLLYSVSEAARLLSCSRSTVYSFIKGGQILAVYPTSKARISATSLVRFVEMKEREARDSRAAISQEAK